MWLLFSGILMLPVFIDWVTDAPFAEGFFEVALVTAAFAGMVVLATRRAGPFSLRLREAFLLTTLAWLSLPAFAALPLMTYGIGFTDGYFEAMSGLTTTGSTVLSGLDNMDRAVLFWRALLPGRHRHRCLRLPKPAWGGKRLTRRPRGPALSHSTGSKWPGQTAWWRPGTRSHRWRGCAC